jgi:hypothetical protein
MDFKTIDEKILAIPIPREGSAIDRWDHGMGAALLDTLFLPCKGGDNSVPAWLTACRTWLEGKSSSPFKDGSNGGQPELRDGISAILRECEHIVGGVSAEAAIRCTAVCKLVKDPPSGDITPETGADIATAFARVVFPGLAESDFSRIDWGKLVDELFESWTSCSTWIDRSCHVLLKLRDHLPCYRAKGLPNDQHSKPKEESGPTELQRECPIPIAWFCDLILRILGASRAHPMHPSHRVVVPFATVGRGAALERVLSMELETLSGGIGEVFIRPEDSLAVNRIFHDSIIHDAASLARCEIEDQKCGLDNQVGAESGRALFDVRVSLASSWNNAGPNTPLSALNAFLDGPSAGGAAFQGLLFAWLGKKPDREVIVIARVDRPSGNGEQLRLTGFEAQHIPTKVQAVLMHETLDTIVVVDSADLNAVEDMLKRAGKDPKIRKAPFPFLVCSF